jgi:hypothetical protein
VTNADQLLASSYQSEAGFLLRFITLDYVFMTARRSSKQEVLPGTFSIYLLLRTIPSFCILA